MTTLFRTSKLSHKRIAGFTLVELMIVVAIVGILAAIAYPSYIDSVRKGNRAEGRAAVTSLLQQQERFFTQNNTYVAFNTAAAATAANMKDYSGDAGRATAKYLLVANLCAAIGGVVPPIRDCVDIVATPQAGIFNDPDVTSMAMDTQGRRVCTGANTSRCWK
jgi:type IV pilus assembly protein PilE